MNRITKGLMSVRHAANLFMERAMTGQKVNYPGPAQISTSLGSLGRSRMTVLDVLND